MTDFAAYFSLLNEADALKSVHRETELQDGSRAENSAEHSWHVALFGMVFGASDRALAMILLHDLVEIDCGDHPIHLPHDWDAVQAAETAAARRLFGLVPDGDALLALWQEFEEGLSPDAQIAKRMDHVQPLFQVLMAGSPPAEHVQIALDNMASGRVARMEQEWPEVMTHARALIAGRPLPESDFARRLNFLATADRLKTVMRAGWLINGTRNENSAEHSWHLALYALVMRQVAGADVDISRVIRMLILHDLVEIDTGDVPIHAQGGALHHSAAQLEAESAAATRIFGLLPVAQAAELRAIWNEFEQADTPDARFAKALDRAQPVALNLANDGGTWRDFNVTYDQLVARVGVQIQRGAPDLWDWLDRGARCYFAL